MAYLDPPTVFYANLTDKKYSKVKADILKLYVESLESSHHPLNKGVP
jgi:hypothetical protein